MGHRPVESLPLRIDDALKLTTLRDQDVRPESELRLSRLEQQRTPGLLRCGDEPKPRAHAGDLGGNEALEYNVHVEDEAERLVRPGTVGRSASEEEASQRGKRLESHLTPVTSNRFGVIAILRQLSHRAEVAEQHPRFLSHGLADSVAMAENESGFQEAAQGHVERELVGGRDEAMRAAHGCSHLFRDLELPAEVLTLPCLAAVVANRPAAPLPGKATNVEVEVRVEEGFPARGGRGLAGLEMGNEPLSIENPAPALQTAHVCGI